MRAKCHACQMRRVLSDTYCRKCAPKNIPNPALVLLRQWLGQDADRGPDRLSRDATSEKIRRIQHKTT